ncbi:MAG: glycoside hydrolase family 5 protein [Acetobacteraceae bacterium]|nr:glycoside hydrolase family 5 protein [Acetobacteraceae bacterium]
MNFLSVRGNQIIDAQRNSVRLRGTCVGGWMNMEDFINGFSGAEHTLRVEMGEVLGASKAEFFFERFLDHFFNEADIEYLKSLGMTVVRLPLNYRHFEDDQAPFVYKEAGFQRLAQVLRWCEKHGLYAILDLHAVQGWQNVHWHSDNASRLSLFWHSAQFQDRFLALWREIARRYKDEAVVAGYNLMNEPCANNPFGDLPWNVRKNYRPNWDLFNSVYRRAVGAVREIDQNHIIFLEGDRYSYLFGGLEEPFAENLVYSSHNYTAAGFGPGHYPGTIHSSGFRSEGPEHWDIVKQESEFLSHEGTVYTKKHGVPLWVGEFGSVYNGPSEEVPDRLRAMEDQIGIFERYGAHWTTWTYKDVGVMGLVVLDPASEYLRRAGDFIRKKELLGTDDWMAWMPPTPVKEATARLAEEIYEILDDDSITKSYNQPCFSQAALCFYTGALMQRTYANLFRSLSETQIDQVLSSFSLKQCKVNDALAGIVLKYAAFPTS